MSPEPVITARGLGKAYKLYQRPVDRLKQMIWRGRRNYYREFWALRDVDFDVYPGETIGVIGRNGAGKSTLLQLICGTIAPTTGSLAVTARLAALLELGSGFNPEFTGRENVFINASVLGMSESQIRERLDDILAFADIGDFIDQPVRTYSSGMQARLAFSVAIHTDPEVLIVDEILAVGDAGFQRKCIERFYKIRDSGCTILFVSHDPYMVKSICRRAIYLDGGRRVAYGAADEVIDRYIVDTERANARSRQSQTSATEESAPANPESPFRVTLARLEDEQGRERNEVRSGETVLIRMRYVAQHAQFPEKVSFVVNVYRHDDFYVCGTTTLMDGLEPFDAAREGEVLIRFPRFQLLAGEYKLRVAINDHVGLGIFADARLGPIRVVDDFQSVGLVHLPREWVVRAGPLEPAPKAAPAPQISRVG